MTDFCEYCPENEENEGFEVEGFEGKICQDCIDILVESRKNNYPHLRKYIAEMKEANNV